MPKTRRRKKSTRVGLTKNNDTHDTDAEGVFKKFRAA